MEPVDNRDLPQGEQEILLGEKSPSLSIVIPAFNEEGRLPSTLCKLGDYLSSRGKSCEIIIVDDGSSDKTVDVVKRFVQTLPGLRLLVNPGNRGKGYSVRYGVWNACGEKILFCDADGATPFSELERLEAALNAGADIAVGSRAMLSAETHVKTSWYRKGMGRVFNRIANLVLVPDIADTQCGFKLFRRRAARYVFSLQRCDRFAFDVEVLFLAKQAGLRVAEVPVNWTNVPGSKVNLVKDSLGMFLDIWRFRLRDLFGGYKAG